MDTSLLFTTHWPDIIIWCHPVTKGSWNSDSPVLQGENDWILIKHSNEYQSQSLGVEPEQKRLTQCPLPLPGTSDMKAMILTICVCSAGFTHSCSHMCLVPIFQPPPNYLEMQDLETLKLQRRKMLVVEKTFDIIYSNSYFLEIRTLYLLMLTTNDLYH